MFMTSDLNESTAQVHEVAWVSAAFSYTTILRLILGLD